MWKRYGVVGLGDLTKSASVRSQQPPMIGYCIVVFLTGYRQALRIPSHVDQSGGKIDKSKQVGVTWTGNCHGGPKKG